MYKRLLIALAVLAVVAGCAGPQEAVADPPDLVTEDYLRRQLAIDTAEQTALLYADIVLGPLKADGRIVTTHTDRYNSDGKVDMTYVLNEGVGLQRHLDITIDFDGPIYADGAGSVTTTGCRTLPGSGDVTSGKYKTFDNENGTADLDVDYTESVSLGSSRSTSLSENVELSNSTTVEAGVNFGAGSGSVSDTLSETFGIASDETKDSSTEHTESVDVSTTVSPGQKLVVVITDDAKLLECDAHINGAVDWTKITATIQSPDNLQEPWKSVCEADRTLKDHEFENLCYGGVYGAEAFHFEGRTVSTSFDSVIDILRLASGKTTRLPPGTTWDLTQGTDVVAWLEDDKNRWLSLRAKRRSAAHNDAGYQFVDATGVADDCISDSYGAPGKSPTPHALDACR